MLAGMALDQPAIWRHGLLIQLAGMDLLDGLRLLICYTIPSMAPYPMDKYKENGTALVLLVAHHTVSLTVSLPVCIYYSHLRAFQEFGAMIMGGPALFLVVDQLLMFAPHSYTKVHIFRKGATWLGFSYQRIVYYFPSTYGLLQIVFADSISVWVKGLFTYGATMLALFNLLVFLITSAGWLQMIAAACKKDEEAFNRSKKLAGSATHGWQGVAGHVYSVRELETDIFVASRLHTWHRRTKERISARDSARAPKAD